MKRYTTAWLNDVLVTLFMEAGASREVSETTSSILIEGDLLGHHTHGIKLANGYLRDLKSGHACGDHTALSVKKSALSRRCSTATTFWGPTWYSKH